MFHFPHNTPDSKINKNPTRTRNTFPHFWGDLLFWPLFVNAKSILNSKEIVVGRRTNLKRSQLIRFAILLLLETFLLCANLHKGGWSGFEEKCNGLCCNGCRKQSIFHSKKRKVDKTFPRLSFLYTPTHLRNYERKIIFSMSYNYITIHNWIHYPSQSPADETFLILDIFHLFCRQCSQPGRETTLRRSIEQLQQISSTSC